MNLNKDAIRLLDRLYKDLYLDEQVLHHGTGNKYDKFNNIEDYLNKLESVHNKISVTHKHIEYLKKCYYDRYVIKEEDIPGSYYEHRKQVALDRGMGHIEINNFYKKQLQNEVIENQKRSLDTWIDYFLSEDSKVYPFWTKYWAFQGMLNLGYFDKEKSKFYKRTKGTIYPFCDLNREALSMSIDLLIKSLNKEIIEDKDLETLVKSGSFQKIYTYILTKVLNDNKNIAKRNIGKWVKYDQGSDHMPLVNSLKGYNTGWCTAGESTAKIQLQGGDFYVYYTLDDNDEYKVPRIAIRMESNFIGEIRGISENQEIEPEMERVVEEKIKDFPDKDEYYKKINNMKELKKVYEKHNNNEELTREELIFLYELYSKIEGCWFYYRDPRIFEILEHRNKRNDLAFIFNCEEKQIAFTEEELVNNSNIIYYDGSIDLSDLQSSEGLVFPKYIKGTLDLSGLKTAEGLVLPENVGGLYLCSLISAKGLVFPKQVRGTLDLERLETAEGLELPEQINGVLRLPSIKKINGFVLPKKVTGGIVLDSVEKLRDIDLPKNLTCPIYLKKYIIMTDHKVYYRNKPETILSKVKKKIKKITMKNDL